MKKLMIAAAIVCAAAFAQAATITWGSKNIYTGDTTTLADGTAAYLFSAVQQIGPVDPGTQQKTYVTLTTAKIIEALSGAGAADANTWLSALTKIDTAVGTGDSAGKVENSAKTVDPSTAGLVADGTEQTLFMLVFDTDTVTDDSRFYVTSYANAVAPAGDTTFSFGNQRTGSQNPDNWYSVVPEPTSGLLLLLGVAGLALRRRRA